MNYGTYLFCKSVENKKEVEKIRSKEILSKYFHDFYYSFAVYENATKVDKHLTIRSPDFSISFPYSMVSLTLKNPMEINKYYVSGKFMNFSHFF